MLPEGVGGRTSSKNHVKNYFGMQKVYADFQRLNKQMLVASKFSFSVANYSHKRRLQCTESDDLTEHYIIRLHSARDLVLPPC